MIIASEAARVRAGDGPWIPVYGLRLDMTFTPSVEIRAEYAEISGLSMDIPCTLPEEPPRE